MLPISQSADQSTDNVCRFPQKQKAQESEAACSRLDLLHKKEQAENARLKAKLSGDEKQVHDVLQQISQVRCMHDSLLQTVGEANKHIVEGEECYSHTKKKIPAMHLLKHM